MKNKHISKRKEQINWEYLIPPQIGIVTMAYGPAGVGKTKTIETLAKARERRWIRTPLPARQPEDIGGYPDKKDIVIEGSVHQVIKMVELEEMVRARLQHSVMLIDEFTSVSDATQAAALTWMDNPPANCWVFAAGNRMDQATNGNPLAEPMINRMCIVDWKVDKSKWIEGMTKGSGIEFPAPDVPLVTDGWEESAKFFSHQVTEFLFGKHVQSKPEYFIKENSDEDRGKPFPTMRSWTNLAKSLGAATTVGANKNVMLAIAGGFVGEHIAHEFLDFLEVSEYVDPETLLSDPQEVKMPQSVQLVMSYVSSVLRRVKEDLTERRWENARLFLGTVYKTHPDIARQYEAKLWQMKPDGHTPEIHPSLAEMEQERIGIK